MPDYSYAVFEMLELDEDGGARCSREIQLQNSTPAPVSILVDELQEYMPDTARDFVVLDDLGALTETIQIEDGFSHQLLQLPVRARSIPGGESVSIRIQYTRSILAHADRGFLNLGVAYASKNTTAYSLTVTTPTPIDDFRVNWLEPRVDGDAPDPEAFDSKLVFQPRTVSMNKRFRLDLSLDVLGSIDVPRLVVLELVTANLKNGTWFPPGWES